MSVSGDCWLVCRHTERRQICGHDPGSLVSSPTGVMSLFCFNIVHFENSTRLVMLKMLPSCWSQIFPISSKYYLSHKKCYLSGELLPLLNNITCPSELFPFLRNICLMCWTSEPEHFTASRESSDQGHYQARVSISHHITHQPGTNIYLLLVFDNFWHQFKIKWCCAIFGESPY